MIVPPKGLGPVQQKIYDLIDSATATAEKIQNDANAVVADVTNQFKESVKTPSPGEANTTKFEKLAPSTNVVPAGSEVIAIEASLNCDEVYAKLMDNLEQLKIKISGLFSDVDTHLAKMEQIQPILDFLKMLCPPSIPPILPNPFKFISWLFDVLKGICNALLFPIVQPIDEFYIVFRRSCTSIAILIVENIGIVELKCITNCNYKDNEAACPVCVKAGWTSCKVKPLFKLCISLNAMIVGIIDAAILPINAFFMAIEVILKPFAIVGFVPRQYPTQTISSLIEEIKAKSKTDSNVKKQTREPISSIKV